MRKQNFPAFSGRTQQCKKMEFGWQKIRENFLDRLYSKFL